MRALYKQVVLVTVEPQWAKLLDFETTDSPRRSRNWCKAG